MNTMDDLVGVVNRIHDALTSTGVSLGLSLPQISVIGGQSSGKSSVLENFVGRDFLPRGSGIVTRRPLILQLHYYQGREYGEFIHKPDKKYTDFAAVRDEIIADTERVVGNNKGISNLPINLKIYSPNVLDLTVIDLPGMTRVPVGDQPSDIEFQIRSMISDFIKPENTIILAVTPANQDLANSEALNLAREVDPQGDRTLGVVTKLDLMDEGTDALSILNNQTYPLKLGYIGVVNRSQKDIDDNKSMAHAQQKESNFFTSHPKYRNLNRKQGSRHLQEQLNLQLGVHIRNTLPQLYDQLKQQMTAVEKQLAEHNVQQNKTRSLIRLVDDFKENIAGVMEGRSAVASSEIHGGAILNHMLYTEIYNLLDLDVVSREEDVAVVIRNLHGTHNPLFLPQYAFDYTVEHLVAQYKRPINQAVQVITTQLKNIVRNSIKQMDLYPTLQQNLLRLVSSYIDKQQGVTVLALQTHIEAEASFMNTRHPDFNKPPCTCSGGNAEAGYELRGVSPVRNPQADRKTRPTTRDSKFIESSPQVIYKGWLTVVRKGLQRSKNFWFVLSREYLYCYRDDKENDERTKFILSNITCCLKKENGYKNKIVFTRSEPFSLPGEVVLQVITVDEASAETWKEMLEKAGVQVETQGSTGSLCSNFYLVETEAKDVQSEVSVTRAAPAIPPRPAKLSNHGQMLLKDDEIKSQVGILSEMIASYMNIVRKTIHDITPKYTMLLLVKRTVKYISEELLSDLLEGDTDVDVLMELHSGAADKIEKLTVLQKATSNALKLISAVQIK